MNKIFEYTLNTYDIVTGKMITVHGVVYAKRMSKALSKLEYYYGDDINSVKLTATEELPAYEFERGSVGFSLKVNEDGEIDNG